MKPGISWAALDTIQFRTDVYKVAEVKVLNYTNLIANTEVFGIFYGESPNGKYI